MALEIEVTASRLAMARGDEPADLVFTGGRVPNLFNGQVEETSLAVGRGMVVGLGPDYRGRETIDLAGAYLLPGFIDGHIHVESSLLSPGQMARAVAPRGTSAVVADPHEIANVMGAAGVKAMLAGSRDLPVSFFFMAPSCVPATHLETSGASLDAADLFHLAAEPRVLGLAEVMNFPGAMAGDPEVLAKLAAFADMPVDGHAPLVRGRGLNAYLTSGPESDHECSDPAEAAEKLARGMWLMIRQGTSAQNLADLLPLVNPVTERRCCLVSDDRHPDDLAEKGHVDDLLRLAVAQGLDPISALRMVTLNPARRFGLKRRGALAPGWVADLVVAQDLTDFAVRRVYKEGRLVAADGECLAPCDAVLPRAAMHTMHVADLSPEVFKLVAGGRRCRVIGLVPGQILTSSLVEETPQKDGRLAADPDRDLARLSVLERHQGSGRVGHGLIKGLGLAKGALAGSVAHDSHNLVVAGMDTASMHAAAAKVVEMGGGLAVAEEGQVTAALPLPLAGLMSHSPLEEVLGQLKELRRAAGRIGSLAEPFMPLSFIALPVIPALKLTDRGLVDVEAFKLVDLFVE